MNDFTFHRPSTVAEAVTLMGDSDDARPLSGGQSLLPVMKLGLASPEDVIDLKGVAGMRGVRREGDRLVVGAATTHAEVNGSGDVRAAIPALADLAGLIGDSQVRNRGTMGGSLAHADPRADYPGAVQALDGIVHTDRRTIPAAEFFTGLFMTALEEDELITAVSFRIPDKAAYAKFPHPASKFPVVGVFVARFGSEVRAAVTGAGDYGHRSSQLEAALASDWSGASVAGVSISPAGLQADADFSAEYRAHLIPVMAKRAVAAAG